MKEMKKPYRVMKFIACNFSIEGRRRSAIGHKCGDIFLYSEYMPKPKCEKCPIFIEILTEEK